MPFHHTTMFMPCRRMWGALGDFCSQRRGLRPKDSHTIIMNEDIISCGLPQKG